MIASRESERPTLRSALGRWFDPPASAVRNLDRASHQARMTDVTLRLLVLIGVVAAVLSAATPSNEAIVSLAVYGPTVAIFIGCMVLVRRGRPHLAAWIVTLWLYAVVTATVVFFGGLMANNSVAYIITVMLAGTLIGRRAAYVLVLLCVSALGILLFLELEDHFPPSLSVVSPINAWVAIVVTLVLAALLHTMSVSSLDASLGRTAAAIDHLKTTQRDNHLRARFGGTLAALAESALQSRDARSFAAEARTLIKAALQAVSVHVFQALDDGSLRPLGADTDHELRLDPGLLAVLRADENGPLVIVPAAPGDALDTLARRLEPAAHATILGVAVRGRTRMLGVLTVALPTAEPLPRAAEQFIETAAGLIGGAMERDLAQTRAEHAQKMELVGRFASGVAHDFNNLLMAMVGVSSELRDRHPADLPTNRALDDFDGACQRASLLTRQLMTFARRQNPVLETVDLGRIVAEFLPMVGRLLGDDIQLVYGRPRRSLPVVADRGNIEQLLMNLIVNARDAMPVGGTITVEVAPLDTGGQVLRVSDTGFGMDAATRARVFEPFFTTKLGGTGLGLATVRDIVQRHAATIDLDTAVGRGTTFAVTFPEGANAPPPTPTTRRVQVKSIPKSRVLLADDHALVRATTRRMLQRLGHEVVAVDDGAEALSRLQAERFDLLVTDEAMPGLTGQELLAELERLGLLLPTVIVSGHSDPADRLVTPNLRFLAKPFSDVALAEAVQAVLSPPHPAPPPAG